MNIHAESIKDPDVIAFENLVRRTGIKAIRGFARIGLAYYQCILSLCYSMGFKVEQSYNMAMRWIQKSAEQNYAPAQRALGRFYEVGRGVPHDKEKALEWYSKAAAQGVFADSMGGL